jgi:hypothetical protein
VKQSICYYDLSLFPGSSGYDNVSYDYINQACTISAGLPSPPLARTLVEGGTWVSTGVLLVRLHRTTVFKTKMYRPQAILQLDHIGKRQEMRQTGVRERWARQKGSLKYGIVEWGLGFSFCVDVEEGSCKGKDSERFLQVRLFRPNVTS